MDEEKPDGSNVTQLGIFHSGFDFRTCLPCFPIQLLTPASCDNACSQAIKTLWLPGFNSQERTTHLGTRSVTC